MDQMWMNGAQLESKKTLPSGDQSGASAKQTSKHPSGSGADCGPVSRTAPLVPSALASDRSKLESSNVCCSNAIVPDCAAAVDGTTSAATASR
jgi:hypothetical protein